MTAFLSLVRAQVRGVWWLLVISALPLLTLTLGLPGLVRDFVSFICTIFMLLTLGLSGPIVFGMEYVAGASDYLSSKPIRPRRVFTIKVTLLITMTLALQR